MVSGDRHGVREGAMHPAAHPSPMMAGMRSICRRIKVVALVLLHKNKPRSPSKVARTLLLALNL